LSQIPSLGDERIRPAFRLALFVCVLAIAYLAFAPVAQVPGTPSDKLNHVFAFAVLAWLADMAYPGHLLAAQRLTLLLGYGLLIELVQGFLPYRELSPLDLAANAAGILCHGAIVRIRGRWQRVPTEGDAGGVGIRSQGRPNRK
jgi:VanZ family protein